MKSGKRESFLFSILLFVNLLLLTPTLVNAQKEDEDNPQTGCTTEKQISKGARKDFQKGLELFKTDNCSTEAYTFFSEVAEQEPTFADAFYLMGVITMKQIEKYSG